MKQPVAIHSDPETPLVSPPAPWIPYARATAITAMTCLGFTAVASWVLVLKLQLAGFEEEGLMGHLLLKGFFFTALLILTIVLSKKIPLAPPRPKAEPTAPPLAPWYYALVILLLAAMLYPNLTRYPWTAPDELHHLVVARNLAVHNAYASGNPYIGLHYFDYYDSVGVSVLGPLALVFKLFGATLLNARIFLASNFALLALGAYYFIRRYWNPTAALLSTLTLTFTFGSLYLARSLYGEVPALMFFLWSMVCWGKSFDSPKRRTLCIFAGILWGLAALAKTFMLLTVFPILAVYLYDRLTTKTIRWDQVLLPALAGLGVLALWSGVVAHYSHLKQIDISTIVYYRHYLMFGLNSFSTGLHWFYDEPFYGLSLIITLTLLIPSLVGRRDNPAVWVLLMTALLYLYWWLFFTPGTLARYLWYTCALLGIFSGPILHTAWDTLRTKKGIRPSFIILLILIPCAITAYQQGNSIYQSDEAVDERRLADYLHTLPPGIEIGTNFPPARQSMDFMANRRIDFIEDLTKIDDKYTIIIYNSDLGKLDREEHPPLKQIGRYLIEERHDQKEALVD